MAIMMQIEIASIPPGEAPEEVRQAWVGLVLPLAAAGVRTVHGVGVLTGPKTSGGILFARLFGRTQVQRSYIVDANRAVEILAAHSPDAAAWWREYAAARVQPGQYFAFDAAACRET